MPTIITAAKLAIANTSALQNIIPKMNRAKIVMPKA
jgi:hypothetical protein